MNKFAMYGKLTALSGKRDELVGILLEAADILQSNANCDLYIVNVSDDYPDTVWVTELWKDQEAQAASLADTKVLELLQRGRPLIAGGEPLQLRPVGGKGL